MGTRHASEFGKGLLRPMKLYDLKRGDKIKVDEGMITFDHLDGMYSYCIAEWVPADKYNVIHLSGGTPLKKVGDHYEIDHESQKSI